MPAFVPPGVIGHNRSLFARNYAILPPDGMFPSLLPGLHNAQVFLSHCASSYWGAPPTQSRSR